MADDQARSFGAYQVLLQEHGHSWCRSRSRRVFLPSTVSADASAKPFSYVLFSIGNIKPLFSATFASCWKTYKRCNKTWVEAVEYLEICGIIVGQILVGILGDWYVS